MRSKRKIIAINSETGERKAFDSVYDFAKQVGTAHPAVLQALNQGWNCMGWMLYDSPERIRERITALEEQLKIVEEAE